MLLYVIVKIDADTDENRPNFVKELTKCCQHSNKFGTCRDETALRAGACATTGRTRGPRSRKETLRRGLKSWPHVCSSEHPRVQILFLFAKRW